MKWVSLEEIGHPRLLVKKWEEYGADVVEKWKEHRALSELEERLKAGADRVKLMLEGKPEPGRKRNREDNLIEEMEGLASLAKKLKKDRAKAARAYVFAS